VIVAPTTPSVLAAKAATEVIPIVFFVAGDPVDLGLFTSPPRPRGNLTGATTPTFEVAPQWLQLFHEMGPQATSPCPLINPTSPKPSHPPSRHLETVARSRGLKLHLLHASADPDFEAAFENVTRQQIGGLIISSDSFFFSRSAQLAMLAARHAVPTIFGFREFVAAGGLMSYGGSLAE